MVSLELFPCEIDGEPGLDVRITDRNATVADLLASLQQATDDEGILKPFHRQRYARCAGCTTNCCKYNFITPDLVAANALTARFGLDLPGFAERYLNLGSDLPYPEFKRRPCPFLADNRCTVYQERALICRLYLCTPMTDRLEQLRAAVSFAGEAALKQRLVDLGLGPAGWRVSAERRALRLRRDQGQLSPEAYAEASEQLELRHEHNPFLQGQGYARALLVECCTDRLWQSLTDASARL